MAIPIQTPFILFDIAHITGGKIIPTHCNHCPALDGGPCNCATAEFRVVRSRPAKKARVTR
jgi:hypothetical protein